MTRAHATGRYVLYLDILGFSRLIETRRIEEVYGLVNEALRDFGRWEDLNRQFRTIHFSDSFVLYQDLPGYAEWAFLDVYALGAMLLSALLSKGIPARGAISFGEFLVQPDETDRHQVFIGRALVEAYRAEQIENWIGVSILPCAWKPHEASQPGIIATLESEGTWVRRSDDVLLLNPFIKLQRAYLDSQLGDQPGAQWLEFQNEIKALRFLRREARSHSMKGDFTGKTATKYYSTLAFLKRVLGKEAYEWAARLSEGQGA